MLLKSVLPSVFHFFLSLVAMAFPMASSLTLEFGDWSDADSIGEVSAYGNASVSSGSTCASGVLSSLETAKVRGNTLPTSSQVMRRVMRRAMRKKTVMW